MGIIKFVLTNPTWVTIVIVIIILLFGGSIIKYIFKGIYILLKTIFGLIIGLFKKIFRMD